MPSALALTAFLHAHGLRAEPEDLEAALAEAVASRRAVLYPFGGRSGLTAPESDALRRGGFDLEPRDLGKDDPVVRAAAEHAAILASALTTSEAAARLGVSEGRIRQRFAQRTLVGLHGRRGRLVPSFQFGPDGHELPGWDRVVAHLPEHMSAVELLAWLTLPSPDLAHGEDERPTSPRDWLLAGNDPARVAQLADGLP
ncbi:MAG: DNA-binding protein [Myxococcota bacterium]